MAEKLEIEFGVKNAALRSGIAEARSEIARFRAEMGSKFAEVLAGLGLGAAIMEVVTYAAEIDDLSAKFDVSTDTLQRWGLAAETNASSATAMAAAFNKLIISQSKAVQGDEALIKDFARLGVTLEDLRTLDPEGLMRKMAEGSLEAANVTQILGRGSLELVPALRAVGEGAADMGSVIEGDTIRALGAAEDKMKEVTQAAIVTGGAVAGWTLKMVRGLSAVAGAVAENAKSGTIIRNSWTDATDALAEILQEENEGREARAQGGAAEVENLEKTSRLRERIADLQAKAAEAHMSKMEQMIALDEKELRLVAERDALGAETEAGLEKQVEIEQVKLDITRLYLNIQEEVLATAEKERKEREVVAERHENELKQGQAKLVEEQGRLAVLREEVAGRDEVARRLERQLEFQGRIKEIEDQIVEARKNGNTALADTLTKLKSVVSQQQILANDVAREALARNGGQAPTTTQLRRQRRADQRSERAAERFRGRLVDGVIPTARDISGRPTRGIDPVTGEERPIGGAPQHPDVFKNPDPRKGPEQIGPQLPPGAKPGGDLQRPGEPAGQDPNSELVAKLDTVVNKLEEIRQKLEPALGVG